jgi:hypothetical protein
MVWSQPPAPFSHPFGRMKMIESNYEEKLKNFSQSVDTYTSKPINTIISMLPTNSSQFGFKSTNIEVSVLLAHILTSNYYRAEFRIGLKMDG